jgi:hypothetical protein
MLLEFSPIEAKFVQKTRFNESLAAALRCTRVTSILKPVTYLSQLRCAAYL